MTTLRLGDTAPDFQQDSTAGPISFHEWTGDYVGGAVLAPERLHAGVHDGARLDRQAARPSSTSAT